MSPAAEILIAILSVTLSVFLVVGIILVIYLIKLTSDIRRVTKAARDTIKSVESVVSKITKVVSPPFVVEMINRFVRKTKKSNKEEE